MAMMAGTAYRMSRLLIGFVPSSLGEETVDIWKCFMFEVRRTVMALCIRCLCVSGVGCGGAASVARHLCHPLTSFFLYEMALSLMDFRLRARWFLLFLLISLLDLKVFWASVHSMRVG
jgi:hypothetical protein